MCCVGREVYVFVHVSVCIEFVVKFALYVVQGDRLETEEPVLLPFCSDSAQYSD